MEEEESIDWPNNRNCEEKRPAFIRITMPSQASEMLIQSFVISYFERDVRSCCRLQEMSLHHIQKKNQRCETCETHQYS